MTLAQSTVDLPRLCLPAHGDTVGLGHIVRTARIARAALALGRCHVRILGGYQHTDLLDLDPRIEVQKLPPLQFRSRSQANDVRPERRRLLERDVLKRAPPDIREALDRYELAIAYSDEQWHPVFDAYAYYCLPARRSYVGVVTGSPPPADPRGRPVVVFPDGSGWAGPPMLGLVLDLLRDRIRTAQGSGPPHPVASDARVILLVGDGPGECGSRAPQLSGTPTIVADGGPEACEVSSVT